jgi:cholest-4-en-3-one 26-monooxygenase
MGMIDDELAAVDITSMPRYLTEGYPWSDWDLLRDRAPVFLYERTRFHPFWAITRYDDVRWVSSHPDLFVNGAGVLRLDTVNGLARLDAYRQRRAERHGWDTGAPLDMLYTDPPYHLDLRGLTTRRFTPKGVTRLGAHVEHMAAAFVEEFVGRAKQAAPQPIDVVENLAKSVPLATICGLLGVPSHDWERIGRFSDQLLLTPNMDDPDVRPGETPADVRRRLGQEYHAYREALLDAARDRSPDEAEDVVTVLVHATIAERPLTDQELHGYLELLVGGGNETTRNTITGGIKALLEHPDQADRLAANPTEMAPSATEEILRWVSPVIQFARTAAHDCELRGKSIRAGDTVVLWYPSANRDEGQFPDPYRFDIGRSPNSHVTFGHGEHFCLGAHVARLELRAVFRQLAPHLHNLVLAGEPVRMPGLHVGAIAHLPVRWIGT